MVGRIKLMFRWAAEKELIPASVYYGLQTLKGLPKGRTEAKETLPVGSAHQEHIDSPALSSTKMEALGLEPRTNGLKGRCSTD